MGTMMTTEVAATGKTDAFTLSRCSAITQQEKGRPWGNQNAEV